jgi:hypothetical protein
MPALRAVGKNQRGGGWRQWRSALSRLIDHDKLAMYKQSQKLFFVRWLEQHPLVRWLAETWATKPWRR